MRAIVSRDVVGHEFRPTSAVLIASGCILADDCAMQMKCDNGHPSCRNCESYEKACVYDELSKRPR
jgi:hypothetical protein